MGDGGRGVPKGTHDATQTDHATQNKIYHRTEQTHIQADKEAKDID